MAENEERFSKIFQEGPLGMAIIDDKYKLARTNKIFRNMLGYNEKELIGMTFVDITHEKDKRKDTDGIKDLYKGKIPVYQTEKRYMKKNGDILWANLTASAIFSEDKKFLYAVSMIEDIGDRKIADQKIKKSLREKEVLLKEIHHRVKNNLQIITSLLHLQAEGINDQAAISLLEESRSRVQAMALLHENLYNAGDLATIDTRDYVTKLTSYLSQTYNGSGRGFELLTKVDDLHLDIDTAIPLGLVINELVSNAFKYAYPESNTVSKPIRIELIALDSNRARLTVSDDGVGLEEGYDQKGSLGLELVHNLTEQLEGELTINRHQGTEFLIEFSTSQIGE